MSQLQEELVVLRERLALHDSDRQATTTQLQNQVPGEAGTTRGHSLPTVEQVRGTWTLPEIRWCHSSGLERRFRMRRFKIRLSYLAASVFIT